jgi:drug/metabolite transporter (DMT)-like permease
LKAKERLPIRVETRVGALSLALMLAGGIIAPLRFVLNKFAVDGGVPPFAFAFWPMLFAGLVLLGVALLRGEVPGLKFTHLRAYVTVGIFAMGAPMAVLTFLADKLPQGLVSMVVIPGTDAHLCLRHPAPR